MEKAWKEGYKRKFWYQIYNYVICESQLSSFLNGMYYLSIQQLHKYMWNLLIIWNKSKILPIKKI
jgi:hypothetical protein